MSFRILGAGGAHPSYVLTNEELSGFLDTSNEWITTRTGIKTRYVAVGESLTDRASQAAAAALERAGVLPSQVDSLICSTLQGDYMTPTLAGTVLERCGMSCPAFDLNAACTGFLYALDLAAAQLETGRAEYVLVISAEMMSRHVDWRDRATCVLFGDGAGAVLLKKGDGLKALRLRACADEKLLLAIGGTYGNSPFGTWTAPSPFLEMQGGEVFKFAVSSMCEDIRAVLKEAGAEVSQVRKVLPHQANQRVIRMAAGKLGLLEEQIASNIDHFGNTSSASIPLLLNETLEQGEIRRGDLLVCSAFGGGLTSGACVIEY